MLWSIKGFYFPMFFYNSKNRKHILQCNLHMSHWQQFLLKCCELLFHDSDDGVSLSSNHDCSSQHQRSNHSIYGHKVRCFRDMIKPSSKKERNPWIPCDKCKKNTSPLFSEKTRIVIIESKPIEEIMIMRLIQTL